MIRRNRTFVLALVAGCVAATGAVAHPGHGHTDGNSTTHFLTEPEHVIALVLALIAVAVTGFVLYRKRSARKEGL